MVMWTMTLNVCFMDLQQRIPVRLKDGGKNYKREREGFFKVQSSALVEDGDYDASDDNER